MIIHERQFPCGCKICLDKSPSGSKGIYFEFDYHCKEHKIEKYVPHKVNKYV